MSLIAYNTILISMKNILQQEDDPYLHFIESPSNSQLPQFWQAPVGMQSGNEMQVESASEVKIEENGYDISPSEHRKKHNSSRPKQKKKVFYRDRVAQLMKDDNYVKQEYNYVDYNHYEKGKSPISREEQLKRNRQSAKNSRMRKKEYVGILQIKNEQNQRTIDELTQKLRVVTLQRDRLKEINQNQIKNYFARKSEAYEALDHLIKNSQSTDQQIQSYLSTMLLKFGAAGTQRISFISYYMEEILQNILADIHKYLLTSATLTQSHPRQHKKLDLDLMEVLHLDSSKLTQLMQKYRHKFQSQSSIFKDLTHEFYRIYRELEGQGRIIEGLFDQMRKELNSRHVAEMIMWFQQNKFRRDVRKVRLDWRQMMKKGQEVEQEGGRKVTKLDPM